MKVRLTNITPYAERVVTDCARVSNPENQGKDGTKLINYLMQHGHWSPFEMAHATFEITTSRAISAQLLRHNSFRFQEASQRYTEAPDKYEGTLARRQAEKNRQSSTDLCEADLQEWWLFAQQRVWEETQHFYQAALRQGVAREQARYLLPLMTQTTLYMTGNLRSWYHYCELRMQPDTQEEHRDIADEIYVQLSVHCPHIFTVPVKIGEK